MTAFSRAKTKKHAIQIKQRRARIQSRLGMKDFKVKHPDWVRDAQATPSNFALIDKKVKEECEKAQVRVETFTRKLHDHG